MSGLREALADVLDDVFRGYATPLDGLTQIDALLPEHRDEVRARIGDEQVGWMAEDCASNVGYSLYITTHEPTDTPVYAPREES